MADTKPAVKEQLAKDAEARKKQMDTYAKTMENAKPSPSQEENDRARLGDDVSEKADDGSGPEVKITLTHRSVEAEPEKPAPATYSTRQVTPPRGGSGSSS